jgi:hypothetical protein
MNIKNGNYSLQIDLYGCGTWSLILMEEQKLRICRNKVLRRISGPEREKNIRKEIITSPIFFSFYLPRHTVIKPGQTTSARHVLGPVHGPNEKCTQTFRIKTRRKEQLRRPGCRWKDITIVNVQECKCKVVQCVQLAQDWIT